MTLKKAACLAALVLMPSLAQAQEFPRWSIGAVGLLYRSPYEAENTTADGDTKVDLTAVPYLAYRGDLFFIEGQLAGIHLLNHSLSEATALSFDAVVNYRSPASVFRDKAAGDAGGRLTLEGGFGSLSLTATHDFTDVNNGYEIAASYGYTFSAGRKLTFTPSVGATWQSRKMANYVWGTSQAQSDKLFRKRGIIVPLYEVTDSVINYSASAVVTYNFSRSWTMLAFSSVNYLDKEIRRHPGIDKDFDAVFALGLAYNF